jgi:hypothetical protein
MDTLVRNVNNVPDVQTRRAVQAMMQGIYDRYSSQALQSAGLVIKAGGSALAKTGGSATKLLADGKLVNIAAATDMAALAGTVTNAKFNVYCFFVDSAGTLTSAMGTEGASLAAVVFPTFPAKKALVGFIIINPTGTGPFVGGTTALDDATVVPNAVFISPQGPFDPSARL